MAYSEVMKEWFWLIVIVGAPVAISAWIWRESWKDLENFLRWPEYLAERDRRKRAREHAINWAWMKKATDEEVHPSMHEPDFDRRVGNV